MVAESGTTNTVVARYLRGINLIAREQDRANQYYLFNAHDDVTQRYDALGNLLKNYKYDSFGNEENPEPLDSNPFRYCGEYLDKEIGEIYLRARYYDPATGRFGAEDPARHGLNWYTYCGNNPVVFVDPTGCYYIVENEEYRDLSMTFYSTGTFSVLPDTFIAAAASGLTTLIPSIGGVAAEHVTPINIYGDIVGGTSAYSGSFFDDILDGIKQSLGAHWLESLGESGRKFNNFSDTKGVIDQFARRGDIALQDKTLFKMMDVFEIDHYNFNSFESAKSQMLHLNEMISKNPNYYTMPYLRSKTIFEIDCQLYSSNDKKRNKLIKSYSNAYLNSINFSSLSSLEMKVHKNTITEDLKKYSRRLQDQAKKAKK
ncbi:RHS repeat-associated core domain-containing protein [Oscillospiraceae bacterium PP1C4]